LREAEAGTEAATGALGQWEHFRDRLVPGVWETWRSVVFRAVLGTLVE
jgi:hypothetical protein